MYMTRTTENKSSHRKSTQVIFYIGGANNHYCREKENIQLHQKSEYGFIYMFVLITKQRITSNILGRYKEYFNIR